MKSQPTIERGAKTSQDVLSLITGKRAYGGMTLKTAQMYEQQIPDGFLPLAGELRDQVKLLKLPAGASRTDIYAAYQADIKLLNSRRKDLVAFIKSGVRASIIRTKERANESTYEVDKDVEMQWGLVEQAIPPAGHAPLINFSADHAALNESELLDHLQVEANAAVDRLLKLVCLWFDTLVAKEFVGLVEFTSAEAARYHYFRPQVTKEVIAKGAGQSQTYDPTAPYGERTTYTNSSGQVERTTHSLERHQHDIVDARTHSVEDYPDRMPQRVCDFLNQTPDWLRKHLVVVSGTITMERVRRRVVHTEDVGEIVTSVWKGSPALALGPYAPLGWSSDDLARETAVFFNEKLAGPVRRALRNKVLATIVACVLGVTALVGGIWYMVAENSRASEEARLTYVRQHSAGQQVLTLEKSVAPVYNFEKKDEKLARITLPGGQPFYYLGKLQGTGSNHQFTFTSDPKAAWQTGARQSFVLPASSGKVHYGTVDLGPSLGIPANMHVLQADESIVQFTIEYYIK